MKISEALGTASDAITVKRVFAEPYETGRPHRHRGRGSDRRSGRRPGTDPRGQQGEGAGFGASARPVGAYPIKDGRAHWRPAIDPNRIITMVGPDRHRLPPPPIREAGRASAAGTDGGRGL